MMYEILVQVLPSGGIFFKLWFLLLLSTFLGKFTALWRGGKVGGRTAAYHRIKTVAFMIIEPHYALLVITVQFVVENLKVSDFFYIISEGIPLSCTYLPIIFLNYISTKYRN